jgi:hypothetical protein
MALDRGGKRDEARPLWEKVLKMAEGYQDAAARARLAEQPCGPATAADPDR